MVLPVSGTAELPHAEESGEGDETSAGDCMEGAEAAVRSLPGFATQRKGTRKGRDGDRKRTERFCLGDCLRRYGRTDDEVGKREAVTRMPSPGHRTTVPCAPWFTKLWAMDEGGLRPQEVSHHETRYRTKKRVGHSTDVARARGARLENPRNFLGDSPTGRTLELRPRQLRDEGMSGVNQHADFRLIHRRFMLLVP